MGTIHNQNATENNAKVFQVGKTDRPGTINFGILEDSKGVTFIGAKNDNVISSAWQDATYNSYFNIDVQQSAYFAFMIDGWKYNRYHTSINSALQYSKDSRYDGSHNPEWDKNLRRNESIDWIPLKSLQYSQGPIEQMSVSIGAFADLSLPFKKRCPTLTCEMYDHRSDFFEMKLREWHAMTVVDPGFVPVLETITKGVTIYGFATNGEMNSMTKCQCILGDDITCSRDYDSNSLKVIQFKLIVVGYD